MKIALVTDLHFGARNDNIKVALNQKKFYDEVFFPYLKEHNIDTVIDLGDTFDRRKYISFTSLKAAKSMFFDPLKENNITTHMIVGNHDAVYRNTNELNSVYLLTQESSNIIEYHQPTEINIGGCEMLIVPWICKDNEKQSYQMIKGTTAQIVMGHLELKGFQMNKGYVVQEGADHTIYDKFDMVCTGHYHHKSTEKNINYLGSPYEMTWMDYEDPKGFHIFDTETRELTRVVNPNRMFYKLWYNDTNLTFEEVMAMDFTPYQNAYVKVIVSNKTNPYLFDTYVDKVEQADPINLQVVEDHLHLDIDDDEDIVNEAEDTPTILESYVDGLDIATDKEKVKELLRSLHDRALSII
jgi:DNA repair exonuclease SbcCD nuclease subunit